MEHGPPGVGGCLNLPRSWREGRPLRASAAQPWTHSAHPWVQGFGAYSALTSALQSVPSQEEARQLLGLMGFGVGVKGDRGFRFHSQSSAQHT